ncbi:hypothetical protein LAZ67_7001295 [Cordylochernes scorpioides]|uniref:Integrase catalytic domain-containing protein n=1 Tax=Cordylochernes scorpioides TaxID=51811 RepID=A0ABY6KQ26_9ARAC|nr:hypothetical protein LAZ67_7001295 [Cordylochernes scorpioides]
MNQVEEHAYDILQRTTKRTGACWVTGLLWRDAEGTLPGSYQMALGRLRHTERKLANDPLLLAAYKAKFDEYQEKEYIRKLDSIKVTKGSERTWYIPHFGVTNPNKSGKLLLVFDAAARSNGVSLNEALSKRLDLIRPLTSVMWNFRVHNIARNVNITTTLFGSKARVAPLKKLTIPKLELKGCVLGTRFAVLLRSELRLPKVDREVFWSDSKTVLAWIRSEAGRYKEFVANRVGEIQEATKGTDWRWVPTSDNPADIATRFETEISFKPTYMWYTGPEFLKIPEEEWPKEAKGKDLGIILATRMLKLGGDSRVSPSSDVECGRKSGKLIRKISQRLLPDKKFETFVDIERCVMVVWKAAKLWRDKTQRKRPRLHPQQYRPAVTTLVQWVQTESFPREIAELAKGRIVKKAKIARLSPCLINGTICLKSRILQANKVPTEQKTPEILPSDHHVMELLIQAEHERCARQGSETLLNNLRGRFWIIDGRQTVLRTIWKCPRCRLSRASPVIPEIGQLPYYRLAAYQCPFTFTGLDAFGPFTVTVGRRHEKRWVIIFTYLVTRAIHLEVVHALNTDKFMMRLSRFIDTRGRPDTIYSDNGTNFV